MSLPALVLTAGLATRLRPLSFVRAKAALPLAGLPLAARVIRWLAAHGTTDVVLNLHHLPHTLTGHIGDGAGLGARVRYSWEDPVLGSAGGPRHALPLLDSTRFLIVNGDTLTDVNVAAMIESHRRTGARVTMALIPNPYPERYGGVLLDGDRVAGFTRREANARNFHFIGVQVVEASVFEPLPDNVPAESVGALYPKLMKEDPGSVRAYVSDARFEDIGTPRDYFETALAVADREGAPAAQFGARTVVEPGARVTRCLVWDDVVIGRNAEIHECIVVDGVAVPEGMQLNRSIILRGDTELPGAEGERRGNLLITSF